MPKKLTRILVVVILIFLLGCSVFNRKTVFYDSSRDEACEDTWRTKCVDLRNVR